MVLTPALGAATCAFCGDTHLSRDHGEFASTMPSDPVDLIDDLVRMGLCKPSAFKAADAMAQMRTALFLE